MLLFNSDATLFVPSYSFALKYKQIAKAILECKIKEFCIIVRLQLYLDINSDVNYRGRIKLRLVIGAFIREMF